MPQKTIIHHLIDNKSNLATCEAARAKIKGTWKSFFWKDYVNFVEIIASALKSLGVNPGDRVALMSNTRLEWTLCDYAIQYNKSITVPIYQSLRAEDLKHILNDSQCKILICETVAIYKKWLSIKSECSSVQHVVVLTNKKEESDDFMTWEELNETGSQNLSSHGDSLLQTALSLTLEDDASILYTSGTTGAPKGVVIGHRQIMSEVQDTFDPLKVTHRDISIGFMPYAHVLGRVESWGHVYKGYCIGFAESIEKMRLNLADIQPTIMIAVPRIFEKVHDAILTQVESSPTKKKIFNWARSVGREYSLKQSSGQNPSLWLRTQYQLAERLVFSEVYNKLGGRLRFAVSGGAPLNPEIARFFHAAGLLILEGYGLTETTAAICVNMPDSYEFGTVGKPLADVDIKIADDGEILVKSNKVMKGYYNNPEATAAVMQDGYFKTGDIGEFTELGHLKITDRKKDLIKTAGGKYIAPQRLEGLLKLEPIISNVLVHGDRRKFVSALITLDESNLKSYAETHGIPYSDHQTMVKHKDIFEAVRKAVAKVNHNLASFETIKKFAILPQDFSEESGELTPSLKVKRKVCDENYKDILDGFYNS